MVGLNRTTIIPPNWERHHRPVAASTMTGLCRVIRPGQPGSYPDFETGPETVLVETVCRVQQQQNRAARGDSQGQLVDSRDYLVTIPAEKWPTGTVVDDTGPILVVDGYLPGHAGDPDLVGRHLRVEQVLHGTLRWERDLYCTVDLTEPGGAV